MTHDPETRPGLSRRGFAGALGAAGLAAAAVSSPALQERAFAARPDGRGWRRPNVLVILADDLGWADLCCYGCPTSGRRTSTGWRRAASGSPRATPPPRSARPTGWPSTPAATSSGSPAGLAGADRRRQPRHPGRPPDAGILVARRRLRDRHGRQVARRVPAATTARSSPGGTSSSAATPAASTTSRRSPQGRVRPLRRASSRSGRPLRTPTSSPSAPSDFVRRGHERPWLLNLNFTTPHWPWEGPGDRAVSDEHHARVKGGETARSSTTTAAASRSTRAMVESLDDLDRAGARRAAPYRAAPGHPRALRQRQRRRAVLAQWPLAGNKVDSTRAGSGCRRS